MDLPREPVESAPLEVKCVRAAPAVPALLRLLLAGGVLLLSPIALASPPVTKPAQLPSEASAAAKLETMIADAGDQWVLRCAMFLHFEAIGFDLRKRMEYALPTYKLTIAMYRFVYQNRDEAPLANALHSYGSCLHSAGRDPEALPVLQESCAIQQRLANGKDDYGVAITLVDISTSLNSLGRCQEATVPALAALHMEQRILHNRDSPDIANLANMLGIYLDGAGRNAAAVPFYKAALEMRIRIYGAHDNPAIADSLNTVGNEFTNLGKLALALPALQTALAMNQRIYKGRDNLAIANSLNNLAINFEYLGRRQEALQHLRSALEMYQRIFKSQDHPLVAVALQNVAVCLQGLGRTPEALVMFQDSLAMSRRIYHDKFHPVTARGLLDVASCASSLGNHQQSLRLLQEALMMNLEIWKGRDHPATASCMAALALEFARVGQNAQALLWSQKGVAMAERLSIPGIFAYYDDLGAILISTGNASDAAKAFGESIDSLEQFRATMGGDDQDRMGFMSAALESRDPFGGMVRAELELGHADTAAEYLDRGRAKSLLDILERGERVSDGDLLDPLEKKARLTKDAAQLSWILQARTRVRAAEDQVRQLTSRINHARSMNNDQGLQQSKALQPKLDAACQEYANAHRQEFNLAGRTTFTEATTSIQIQSLLQARQHLLMYSITAKDAVVLLVSPAGGTISGTYLTEPDGKTRLSGQALQKLIRSYRAAVVQRGMNLVRGARLAETEPTTQAANDATAEGYELFCQLMPAAVWRQIQDDTLIYVVPDASMSGLPLEMLIPQKPRGPDAKDAVYWLDQGPLLCYGPSAASLLELRRQETNREGRIYAHEAVLLGDPVLRRYGTDHVRLAAPQAGAIVTNVKAGSSGEAMGLHAGAVIIGYGSIAVGNKDQFEAAVDKLALLQFHGKLAEPPRLKFWIDGQVLERELPLDASPGLELKDVTPALALQLNPPAQDQPTVAVALRDSTLTRYGGLTPLPGTRREVEGIYQVLTGKPYTSQADNSVTVLLGEDATGQRLAEAAKGTRYLHLATHGLVEPGQNAIYSSVVLSQPSVITPQDTGLLTLEDLFDHWWGRLDGTELVVLSACDSQGLDEQGTNARGGEGVFGLPWGFMYAGSPAVVASLWEVQDASTAEMMQKFYHDMQATPQVNKLSAFAAARKQLKLDYPEPFFWAPFIYLGDPN
jgi:CHAT domain-containing protein